MGIPSTPLTVALRDLYGEEFARIEREFRATSNGRVATECRASLLDRIILDLSREFLEPQPDQLKKISLVALGGYGRKELFPHSDIDLMFLFEDSDAERRYGEGTQAVGRALWDLRLRASPTPGFWASAKKSSATIRSSISPLWTAGMLAATGNFSSVCAISSFPA